MIVHSFQDRLWLPRPLAEVFAFFADAHNLQKITPNWLNFEVLTPAPIRMACGVRIDYRLRLHGLPLRWQSEITEWSPPHGFVDEQRRGPYRLWRHEHRFIAQGAGTFASDNVRYAMWGGRLIHRLFVRRDVEAIFRYRRETLQSLFAGETR